MFTAVPHQTLEERNRPVEYLGAHDRWTGIHRVYSCFLVDVI